MRSVADFVALEPLLALDAQDHFDVPKTIIFTNSIKATQHGLRHLREHCSEILIPRIDCLHALRSPRDKRKAMRKFAQGKIRILIAREAAGMVRYTNVSSMLLILISRVPTYQISPSLYS